MIQNVTGQPRPRPSLPGRPTTIPDAAGPSPPPIQHLPGHASAARTSLPINLTCRPLPQCRPTPFERSCLLPKRFHPPPGKIGLSIRAPPQLTHVCLSDTHARSLSGTSRRPPREARPTSPVDAMAAIASQSSAALTFDLYARCSVCQRSHPCFPFFLAQG